MSLRLLLVLLGALLMLSAGCDSLHRQQYRIEGIAAGSPDAETLRSTLAEVALEVGLEDRTSESAVPATLAWFVEPIDSGFRVELGARFHQRDVLVDLLGGYGGTRGSEKYERAARMLDDVLRREYGSRLSVPEAWVPVLHEDRGDATRNRPQAARHVAGGFNRR